MAVLRFNTREEEEKVEQITVTDTKVTKKEATKKKAETKKKSSVPSRDAINDTPKAVKVTKKSK